MNHDNFDDMDDDLEELPSTIDEASDDELIDELTKRGNFIIINENSLSTKTRILDFLHNQIYPNLNDKANHYL